MRNGKNEEILCQEKQQERRGLVIGEMAEIKGFGDGGNCRKK